MTTHFDHLDRWIRMRLRSKVIRKHATPVSNSKMLNRVLHTLGLVSLLDLRRASLSPGGDPRRLPAPGRCRRAHRTGVTPLVLPFLEW